MNILNSFIVIGLLATQGCEQPLHRNESHPLSAVGFRDVRIVKGKNLGLAAFSNCAYRTDCLIVTKEGVSMMIPYLALRKQDIEYLRINYPEGLPGQLSKTEE